jgi:hypothetical protein
MLQSSITEMPSGWLILAKLKRSCGAIEVAQFDQAGTHPGTRDVTSPFKSFGGDGDNASAGR